jgi:hypothetical protein
MKMRFLLAASAAVAAAWLAPPAQAGCVISPDQKSINVVTDNGSSEQKNCAVKCQVDTKIGVVQVACGGTTPPLAKAHSLCDYDKPEAWYKKVISSEDSCKGGAASTAPAPTAVAPALKPGGFTCRISPDGTSVDAVIVNPYKTETSCQIDCQLSTTKAGTTFSVSCGKPAAPGAEAVLCSHAYDKGKLVKMVGGKGSCVNPEPAAADKEKDDDDDADVQNLINDPARLREHIRKNLDPDAQKMFDKMHKP